MFDGAMELHNTTGTCCYELSGGCRRGANREAECSLALCVLHWAETSDWVKGGSEAFWRFLSALSYGRHVPVQQY
jgi:hypothetical protein